MELTQIKEITEELNLKSLKISPHSFRHGGASRAFLEGRDMSEILVRGRWAVESSGRHYIQAWRQLLLGIALPAVVHELARRLISSGLGILAAPDLAARLRG